MTNWQWDVIIALCKIVVRLSGNNYNDQDNLKFLYEAIARNEKYKEEYAKEDEVAKAKYSRWK